MSQQSVPMTPKLLLMISRHIDNVSLRLASLLVVALDDVDDSIRPPVLALDPVFQIIDGRLKPFDPPVKCTKMLMVGRSYWTMVCNLYGSCFANFSKWIRFLDQDLQHLPS
jgi:hypothetical protein